MPTIAVCSLSEERTVQALMLRLVSLANVWVHFIRLPSDRSDLDKFELDRGAFDGVVLCHSVDKSRFALTDVPGAFYDKFLLRTLSEFGKENIVVIAYDFPWPLLFKLHHDDETRYMTSSPEDHHFKSKMTHMECLRIRQPTTFWCSSLTLIAGKLADRDNENHRKLEIDTGDLQRLTFLLTNIRGGVFASTRWPSALRLRNALVTSVAAYAYKMAYSWFLLPGYRVVMSPINAWLSVVGAWVRITSSTVNVARVTARISMNMVVWGAVLCAAVAVSVIPMVLLGFLFGVCTISLIWKDVCDLKSLSTYVFTMFLMTPALILSLLMYLCVARNALGLNSFPQNSLLHGASTGQLRVRENLEHITEHQKELLLIMSNGTSPFGL